MLHQSKGCTVVLDKCCNMALVLLLLLFRRCFAICGLSPAFWSLSYEGMVFSCILFLVAFSTEVQIVEHSVFTVHIGICCSSTSFQCLTAFLYSGVFSCQLDNYWKAIGTSRKIYTLCEQGERAYPLAVHMLVPVS